MKNGVCAINAMASYPTKESSSSPPPYPSPAVPPPPPVNPPPPPPPSPSPSDCGDYSYCPPDETCCCLLEFRHFCFVQGCCDYENAVCCTGTDYCCPSDFPICDVDDGLCLRVWYHQINLFAYVLNFNRCMAILTILHLLTFGFCRTLETSWEWLQRSEQWLSTNFHGVKLTKSRSLTSLSYGRGIS